MSNVDEYFSHQTELETLRERVLELEHQVRMAGKHADYLTKERVKATKDAAAAEATIERVRGLADELSNHWNTNDEMKCAVRIRQVLVDKLQAALSN